jgi:hypothetical protein
MAKSRSQPIDFNNRLVLFKYLLSTLGAKSLISFSSLNSIAYEGFDESGNTLFYHDLDTRLSSPLLIFSKLISHDKLKQYDENICRHLKQISEKRGVINLKYFQYLSLLFTEIYLDRFFNEKDDFVKSLNDFIRDYSADLYRSLKGASLNMEQYTPDKLNKLGFMCATGSGKTLIMHINILQFRHYNKQASRHYHGMDINKTILLSPNEGMSLQHLDEFRLSNIPARLFQKDGYGFEFSNDDILVIDMNKLKEEGKVKTVAVDSFEQNNLVLIDEAHRGLQGDVWSDYRSRLSADGGFSFEYSATFKQALKSLKPTVTENVTLLNEYGKSIIIDYSYKYFYEDGYGKDYRIYNLQEGIDGTEQRFLYLTGCLLSFYQQVKIFNTYKTQCNQFEIENPLLVFVGNRVTTPIKSGSSLDAAEKELLTDIEEILLFLDTFINRKRETLQCIKKVIEAKTNIVDNRNNDIFSQNFTSLDKIFGSSLTPEILYNEILEMVFNSSSHSENPRLYLIDLKSQGEIGLKIGQNGDFFGIINIGDSTNLIRQCEEKGLVTNKDEFSTPSLFRNINTSGSTIKLLIGSRKFTEGWNCWRVSTMGLINFAKGEGSQAIQLFGRGVRLHGYENRLKRSSKVENPPSIIPQEISFLETLTIFGIKADYMAKFKEFLELEGLPTNEQIYNYSIATVNRFDNIKGKNLKVLRVKDGINFKKQAPRYVLGVPDTQSKGYFLKNKITLDCRAKVQSISSPGDFKLDTQANNEPRRIQPNYLQYLDYDAIYWQLIQYKNEKKYYNIALDRKILPEIMMNENWSYGLIIPEDDLKLNTFEKANRATSYISLVLQSYIDKFFAYQKNKWEDPYLVYQDIMLDDPNFTAEYTFSYKPDHGADTGFLELERYVNDLNHLLSRDKAILSKTKELFSGNLVAIDFPYHLFVPLVYKSDKLTTVQVTPISLNDDEKRFIDLLSSYLEYNSSSFVDKDVFLLRNKSKTGMGFFEAGNFYPDYILWINTKEKQYMTFIDPKGLQYHQVSDPKIQFYKTIKELEKRPLLQATKGKKDIILNSFIISGSDYPTTKNRWGLEKDDFTKMNVLFLEHANCIKSMFSNLSEE